MIIILNKYTFSTIVAFSLTLGINILSGSVFADTTSRDLNINVAVPNILEISSSNDSLNFNDYTGAEEKCYSTKLTVSSGLPYDITGKFLTDIQNADQSSKIPFSDVILMGDNPYVVVPDKNVDIPLTTNHPNGLGIVSWCTVGLEPDSHIKSDNYTSTLRIEISQR